MLDELKKYRACGIILLVMNLALAFIIFFMERIRLEADYFLYCIETAVRERHFSK